jgi:hypothetical protein
MLPEKNGGLYVILVSLEDYNNLDDEKRRN